MKEKTVPTEPKNTPDTAPEISITESERINRVAEEIMARFKPAFEELAK